MSVKVEIEGKLIVKNDTVEVSASFKKREFVIYVENDRNIEYSDKIKIELKQNNTALIDSCNVGDIIKCQCNITGRDWTKDGKTSFFNSLECWKLEVVSASQQATGTIEDLTPSEPGDSLPF